MSDSILNGTLLNTTAAVLNSTLMNGTFSCKFLHPLELPWWLVIDLALVLFTLWNLRSNLDKVNDKLATINAQLAIIAEIAAKHNAAWDRAEKANSEHKPLRGTVVTGRIGYWPKDS